MDDKTCNVDRRESSKRWLILCLCCLSTFGDYYCIDNVGVLHDTLKVQFDNKLKDSFEYYFGLLYSLYSMPNIILPFIGGLLILKFGNRTMYIVLGGLIMLGQLIFAIGCSYTSMNIMLLGRIIFGLGGETLNICQNSMIVKWFYKSNIALPLGLTISVSRLGSVLNDIASPRLVADENNASYALYIGFGICVLSFIASVILCMIDYNTDKEMNDIQQQELSDEISLADSITAFRQLGLMFWIITLLCLTLYGAVLPFNYIASGFLIETYFKSMNRVQAQNHAGVYMSVPFFISAFMVPIYGLIIDKYGQRAYLSLVASIMGLICFLLFFVCSPLPCLIILGLTYSMFASVIWPSISLVVKKAHVGFAYGVTTSLQNAGLSIFPIIVAAIYSNSKSYYTTLQFFVILMVISILLSFVLISVNKDNKNIINETTFDENETEEIDEEKKQLIKNDGNSEEKGKIDDNISTKTPQYQTI